MKKKNNNKKLKKAIWLKYNVIFQRVIQKKILMFIVASEMQKKLISGLYFVTFKNLKLNQRHQTRGFYISFYIIFNSENNSLEKNKNGKYQLF